MKKAKQTDYKYLEQSKDNCNSIGTITKRKNNNKNKNDNSNFNFNEKLRSSGRKSTKLGTELYNLLLKNKQPLTAHKIHKSLNTKVNLSSVYRTLKKFLQLGLVFEEKIEKESYYYISKKHHHHIICIECGSIMCIPCNLDFSQINNFTEITHHLSLKGLCSNCSKNKDI